MKIEINPAMDYRSFDSIVQGRTSHFNAIEILPVRDYFHEEGREDTFVEADYENPTFFSVYLHLKEGGVMCIGDHGTHALALAYAQELSQEHGWQIHDFVPNKFHDAAATEAAWQLTPESVRRLMRQNGKTIRGLARQMNITMTRVRQVRECGVKGKTFYQDWMEALTVQPRTGQHRATAHSC